MTDANGREMSNRWEEALVIRQWVLEMWQEMEERDASNHPGGQLSLLPMHTSVQT